MPENPFPPPSSGKPDRFKDKIAYREFSRGPVVESRGSHNGTFLLVGVLVALLLVRLIFGR